LVLFRLQASQRAHLAIYREGHPEVYDYVDDDNWEVSGTMDTVSMTAGQRVWVQVVSDSPEIRGSDRTLFTGFLLHAA
jgi:hypothetical protein